ncbi:MAG: 16S rRNA (guanine(966)-N(2))-methyltransferase RsmD [Bacilli bacterium]
MRVISGLYKGKQLEGFNINGTRPTMDRVKESMFAMLQGYLKDSIVLDLFAGAGNLGIEAISNGATCYFVDNNKIAIETIIKNTIDMDNKFIMKKDCFDALEYFKINNIKFDIILLDPPYHENLMDKIINKIIKDDLLKKNGLIVCELEEEITCDLKLIKNKKYGLKKVKMFQKS